MPSAYIGRRRRAALALGENETEDCERGELRERGWTVVRRMESGVSVESAARETQRGAAGETRASAKQSQIGRAHV